MDDNTRKFAEHIQQRRLEDDALNHNQTIQHYDNVIQSGKELRRMLALILILLIIITVSQVCTLIISQINVEDEVLPAKEQVLPETLSIPELPVSSIEGLFEFLWIPDSVVFVYDRFESGHKGWNAIVFPRRLTFR